MYSNWYAIQVKSRSEKKVCEKFLKRVDRELYIDSFVPMVETFIRKSGAISKTVKAMFPGYFFVITDNVERVYYQSKAILDFNKVIRQESDFISIQASEADFIAGISDESHTIGSSTGYIENDKVYVTSGALKGYEGLIKRIDRHHRTADVELQFLGRPMIIKFSLEIVNKL